MPTDEWDPDDAAAALDDLERAGTMRAPDNQVWVCSACGKESRTKYGFDDEGKRCAEPGWDESCMLHAVLCWRELGPDGAVRPVEPCA